MVATNQDPGHQKDYFIDRIYTHIVIDSGFPMVRPGTSFGTAPLCGALFTLGRGASRGRIDLDSTLHVCVGRLYDPHWYPLDTGLWIHLQGCVRVATRGIDCDGGQYDRECPGRRHLLFIGTISHARYRQKVDPQVSHF